MKLAKWHRCSECNKLRNIKTFSIFNEEYKYFLCNICDRNQYKEAMDAYQQEAEYQFSKDAKVLDILSKKVSEKVYDDIVEYMEDCSNTAEYLIVNKIYGDYQDEEEYSFGGAWVSQSCGIAGDDWSGTIFIKIAENEYFRFSFWE